MQKSVNFTVIFLTAFLFLICSAYGQNKEDKFTGKWLSKDKMIVEVYKVGKGFNIKLSSFTRLFMITCET